MLIAEYTIDDAVDGIRQERLQKAGKTELTPLEHLIVEEYRKILESRVGNGTVKLERRICDTCHSNTITMAGMCGRCSSLKSLQNALGRSN